MSISIPSPAIVEPAVTFRAHDSLAAIPARSVFALG